MKEVLNFINGEFVATGKTFPKHSPLNNAVIAQVHEASRAQVNDAVAAAKAALKGPWGKMTVADRVQMLYAVADEINRRFDDFLQAEVADTGKPVSLASHIDIPRGAANFKVFADTIKNVPTECFEMATPDGRGALNYSIRRPVVGVPPGVYNVVHGFGPDSAGEFVTTHPDVNAITFTGETRTGAAIMKAAAQGARPVSLEMGGKNAAIVFADCDFDAAIEGTMRSVFANSGQVCLGTERVYVERPIFDKFVAAMKKGAEGLKPGLPDDKDTGIGPVISQEHRDKVLGYYRKAVEQGATVVTGGGAFEMPGELNQGAWVQPTIWTGLDDDAAVCVEEIFGPCCHIAPFDSEDEVVARANNNVYGLSTAVWTQNLAKAHRVAASIEVGLAWVNSWFLRDLRTPFGGAKQSGIGREGGVHSLEFYTELKNICVKL
eukprot:gene5463-5340_t